MPKLTNAGIVEFVNQCCSNKQVEAVLGEIENKAHIQQMRDGAIEYTKTMITFFRAWQGAADGEANAEDIGVAMLSTTVKDTNYFYFKFKSYLAPIEKMCAMAYHTYTKLEKEATTRDDYIHAWSTKVNWINIIPAVIYCFYTEIDINDTIKTNNHALTMYFSSMFAMKGGLHIQPLDEYLEEKL